MTSFNNTMDIFFLFLRFRPLVLVLSIKVCLKLVTVT